jgi:3-deoxy-D-manno-octulosonic-acid transferase
LAHEPPIRYIFVSLFSNCLITGHPLFILYSLLLCLGFVLLLPYFLVQALRHGKYLVSLFERTGRLPLELHQGTKGAIWIHAVSVGESNAVAPLVSQLSARAVSRKIFISTTTLTGQQNARERITGANGFFYYPFDWSWNVRRSLRHIQPALVCLAETELWPNFIHEAHRQGIKLVVVNGRISEKSFMWYGRVKGFLHRFLPEIDLFLMQTEEDAERIRRLGAPAERVRVCGNLKYDIQLSGKSEEGQNLIRERFLGHDGSALWIAGSTAEGEEELVLKAFAEVKARIPAARLILAPRRPERFDMVANLMAKWNFSIVRRSQLEAAEGRHRDILLLDSVGELAALYSLAKVAFVGGSLVKKGGHNILEPAAAGVAVLFGPYMSNFQKMAEDFLIHKAALQVRNAGELASATITLLEDTAQGRALGERGRALVAKSSGATAHTVEMIMKLL